jgi:cell division protein FtsB
VRRLPIILLAVAALVGLGLLSSIVTQGFRELAETEAERDRLLEEKARLEDRIAQLEAILEALRTNPEAVESLARRDLGWTRPDEQVILLATPTPIPTPDPLTDPPQTPILTLP